jgi:tRNA threonylcarbamoyladenosine biosynthesis protein TsaB
VVILAIDTVTRSGSLALLDDRTCDTFVGDPSRTHAERLPGEATRLLGRQGRALCDVDLFVVVAGPGSFTGLRVGMAVAQGFALACGRPLATVPTLDAMADAWIRSDSTKGAATVVACLDGQRNDLFFAGWRVSAHEPIEAATSLVAPTVGTAEELAAQVQSLPAPTSLVGMGLERHAPALSAIDAVPVPMPGTLAEAAARIAARRRDLAAHPHAARPLYLRRPDAVLARERHALASESTPAATKTSSS